MVDYNKHIDVTKNLERVQEVDTDNRDLSRDSDHFVNKPDGQWEPDVITSLDKRPRYTFDQCSPVIDQIMGEIETTAFDISVKPSSNGATKRTAQIFDGLIRSIQNISQARDIYNQQALRMVETALGGWRVDQDWASGTTFDQDLVIKPIHNFVDRVWFDPNGEKADKTDSEYCYVLEAMGSSVYDKRFPKGSKMSIGDSRTAEVYTYKRGIINVGEILYKKRVNETLILMNNGKVYIDDEDFQAVTDELAAEGITESRRRDRKIVKVYSRLFDGGKWLTPEQETVFTMIPIVPLFANYKISENKTIYYSAVTKLMDPQRVYNYARSRQIEEGALAPRSKHWMTKQQGEGHKRQLESLNTNADPVQFYNHVENQPPPYESGGAKINIGLQQTAQDAANDIDKIAGMFDASRGGNPGLQSGVAIEQIQNKGDNGTYKYFSVVRRAIELTGRILTGAIPNVYDAERQVRLLGVDGSAEDVTINKRIVDQQTGRVIELNDMSQGTYDTICTIGPAFRNRQQQTVQSITSIAQVDPSIMEIGSDVLLKNIEAPGIEQVAERKRRQMVLEGVILEEQMTDEEKEIVAEQAEAEKDKPPSPVEQALMDQAAAEKEKAEANTADIMSKIDERQAKLDLRSQEIEAKILAGIEQQQRANEMLRDEQLKLQADTLKLIREAMGVDTMVGPGNTEAYIDQAQRITQTQEAPNA